MSRRFPTRFSTADTGAVYASEDPQTALEELRRRATLVNRTLPSFTPRSIFVLRAVLQNVLDLTDRARLEDWGLSEDDPTGDAYARCQDVASAAAGAGYEAIRWRSATGSGNSLAIFFDRLQAASSLQVSAAYDLDLGALARNARITKLLPDLEGWINP